VAGTTALAMGEDFKTGALAGGANEAMVSYLADRVMPEGYEPGKGGAEQAKANLLAMSNVVGLLSSVVTGGDPQVAADIAATATQYNHPSHSDLTRAAKELNACAAKDGGCSEDVLQKFVRLSREQEIAAFQSCAANPDSCATTSSMVANAQARAEQLKDLAATAVAPNAQHVFALLLAENNEVQNALAQVTAGAKVDSVVQELQNRLGFSDARKEMIRDAMVAAASMAVGGKAGRGSAGGAKGIDKILEAGLTPKASELKEYAEAQGWRPSQTDGGPLKYVDENDIPRVTIKKGSSRAPGSSAPHVEFKDATGQRTDIFGNPVTRKSPDNHTSIDFDL